MNIDLINEMDSNEIIEKTQHWISERGIDTAKPADQMLILIEEMGELSKAITTKNVKEQMDAIGDMFVVLVGLSMILGLDFTACTAYAYNQIKNRTGKLIDGVYYKDETLKEMGLLNE